MRHPYTKKLLELINTTSTERNITSGSVRIVNAGKPGEMTASMVERLPILIYQYQPRLTIILGGTNDLAYHKSTADVVNNIVDLHNIALSYELNGRRSYTVAITIPQIGWPWINFENRLEINKDIRKFAKKNSDRIALLDLESTYNQSVSANDIFWASDFVHFTPIGYDGIGERIFERISTFVVKDKS